MGNRNNKYDEHDMAFVTALDKFDEKHPKEMRPNWLENYMTISGNKNPNNNWLIRIILLPKIQLEPNQHWEWGDDGIPVLVRVDPITEERFMVICGGPAEDIETIFEVEVNLAKDLVTILVDTDLDTLDVSKYQAHRR